MTRSFKTFSAIQEGTPGTFSGWASRYNEVDHAGDVVMPGAYDRTVAEHGGEIVLLADHDPSKSIGLARMTLKTQGLWIDARISLDLQDGRDAYVRMRDLKKNGLSIGYSVRRDQFKNGRRELMDIALFEVSSVQFPCLDSARVQSVKGNPVNAAFALTQLARKLRDLTTHAAVDRLITAMRFAGRSR
jgi:HK97 family phage prohead protease